MNGTVLDILLYVFDRYMIDEAPEVPERDVLAQDLASAGFGEANVERALDWLADLAGERSRVQAGSAEAGPRSQPAMRLYNDAEKARLSVECRGQLIALEQVGILNCVQRELVIDRLLALDVEDLTLDQLRWVVLMVLSSQPGQEQACARMETLVFDTDPGSTH